MSLTLCPDYHLRPNPIPAPSQHTAGNRPDQAGTELRTQPIHRMLARSSLRGQECRQGGFARGQAGNIVISYLRPEDGGRHQRPPRGMSE